MSAMTTEQILRNEVRELMEYVQPGCTEKAVAKIKPFKVADD